MKKNNFDRYLVPRPKKVEELVGQPSILITPETVFEVPENCMQDAAKIIREYFKTDVAIHSVPAGDLPEEHYTLAVENGKISIGASSVEGVRYAIVTLHQLSEAERGVLSSTRRSVPACRIEDGPARSMRVLHFCHYYESEMWEVERFIRLAAYFKYNHIIMEFRGTFPFRKHPEFYWNESPADPGELKRLIRLAKELGLKVTPLQNLLGHGTGVGVGLGKHVTLGLNPQYAPLWEPDGWSFCLSNPHLKGVVKDLVEEMYEFFEEPEYFHIGFDEPFNIGSCSLCRHADLDALVLDYTRFLHDILAEKNCRIMLWHDAFVDRDDPRYEGYAIPDRSQPGFFRIVKDLPRDLIFNFWQYDYSGKDGENPTWPVADDLKKMGFDVTLSPWTDRMVQNSMAKKKDPDGKLYGIIQTSWFAQKGIGNLRAIFLKGAGYCWNPDADTDYGIGDEFTVVTYHIRNICDSMALTDYRRTGTSQFMNFPQ